MPHSTRSSSASAPCHPPVDASGCRLERRASPLLVAVLLALALAAAFAVLVSEMPRIAAWPLALSALARSEEHTSELQSLMRTSYSVFCFKKHNTNLRRTNHPLTHSPQ